MQRTTLSGSLRGSKSRVCAWPGSGKQVNDKQASDSASHKADHKRQRGEVLIFSTAARNRDYWALAGAEKSTLGGWEIWASFCTVKVGLAG